MVGKGERAGEVRYAFGVKFEWFADGGGLGWYIGEDRGEIEKENESFFVEFAVFLNLYLFVL